MSHLEGRQTLRRRRQSPNLWRVDWSFGGMNNPLEDWGVLLWTGASCSRLMILLGTKRSSGRLRYIFWRNYSFEVLRNPHSSVLLRGSFSPAEHSSVFQSIFHSSRGLLNPPEDSSALLSSLELSEVTGWPRTGSLYTNRFVLWQATPCFFPRSSSSLRSKSAGLSQFCHFDILLSIFYHFDILRSIFCHIDILRSIFCHFDILSFDILPLRYFFFRYFVTSIFHHFDILHFPYFAIRYFAISMLRPIDILRLRYFANSKFCLSIYFFRYFAIRYLVLEAFKHPPPQQGEG